ncbi:hypothetical protein D6C95_04790 [Aureobasidium pullulans]|nr:hypothetical protein D6C95_04790 [Aureobasidium pullulans]
MADNQDTKPARYRSQRKAPATSTPQTTTDSGLGRSRSRYHHNRQNAAQSQEQPLAEATKEQTIYPSRSRSTRRRFETETGATAGSADDDDDRQYGSMRSSHHKSLEQSDSPHEVDPMAYAMAQAPTRIRAKAEAYIPDQEAGDVSAEETAGCFGGLFGRKKKKKNKANKAAKTPLAPRPATNKSGEPPTVKPGGGGIVPMTDAPLSAANVQGRRVTIECNGKSINLPVTPTTSASDLIASAANIMSENIDLRKSVLLENFHSVGITRPLRRYEHVKDVMNSWDEDRANSLMIVPENAIEADPMNLSAANAPRQKPRESAFLLMHSSKPGSWDKRLITIHQDGQVTMARPDKETDTTNICHLTDFDIYNPTASQLNKKIKPPKKICYAIKSQTKSSMFILKESIYVHFFCTSERTLATSFYDAVQSWRSWYLVNVLEEGKTTKTQELGRSASKATKQSKQSSHAQQPSTGSMDAHYQLGTFKPAMDLENFERPSSSRGQDTTAGASLGLNSSSNNAPARKPSVRERTSHPVSLSKQQQLADDEPLVNLANNRRPSLDNDAAEREAFTSEGLLGRSYSTRQKMAAEKEAAAKNPWVTGPSLLSGDQAEGLNRQTSVKRTGSTRRTNGTELRHRPSTRERLMAADDGLKRSGSTRAKEPSKPLVDLTPTYQPPPQHFKKGKGFHPDQVGPGGLIDNATTPDQPYYIPPAQDWRGGRNHSPAAANAGVSRQRSLAHRPGPETTDEAFTGTGLLNNSRGGYTGKASVGRGVMSGNRNSREPMLDVSEEGRYVPGSLLNQVARAEREEGRGGPIIDRSK